MYHKKPGDKEKPHDSRKSMDSNQLQMMLENMDGAFFQTESDGKDIKVVYASMSLFNSFRRDPGMVGINGENIWDVTLPEDLEPLKNAIIESSLTETRLDYRYRVYNSEKQIEWRHMHGTNLPKQEDGLHRMLLVVSDITKQMQTEAEMREKDSIIDFAMRNTDVNLWYFDYETGECQLTRSCQKAHEMPGVDTLTNFPECLFEMGYVREDCAELLRSAYNRLRDTGESLEFDTWFRKSDGSGWWCERDMLSPLLGPDGRVTRGIGIGKNVTAEKEMEEKFHTFQSYRFLTPQNTLASVRMNLTTGWCGEYVSNHAFLDDLTKEDTVDGFFQSYIKNILVLDGAGRDLKFSRQSLMDSFSRGETSLTSEARCHLGTSRPIWLRTAVDMMKNPFNGDVEALYYTYNIDYEKNLKFVVDQLISTDYEFLGLMDVDTGYLMVFGDNKDIKGITASESFYDVEMSRVIHDLIRDEYSEEGARTMDRAHVIQELDRTEYYTCSFPTKSLGNSHAGRKQWKFSYLDASKSQILISRTDITDIYTAERDALTGLYNRQAFYRHAREVLDANPSKPFVMLRCDIDRFKAYNDARGAQAGDRLLAEYGKIIRQVSWPKLAVFGHIEADHFCALFPKEELNLEVRSEIYYQWLNSITPGYRLISSIGVFDITEPAIDVSLMCDRALLALQTVKAAYGNKIAWYDEGLRHRLIREQILMDEMEKALTEEQFILYFQPQINYETGAIIGAEALVRWLHPERGLIPPNEFIPLFEKNGFILKMDSYVWEKACQYLRSWLDRDEQSAVPISVNISRCDIYDPSLCERLCSLIEKYRLPISMLKLEITESAYMENPEQLLDVAKRLQDFGFTLEMDDFGAGYSSLNTLKDVPVDILKLDMRFLSTGRDDARGGLILSSVIRMAQWLGLPVIAEGVETEAQADYLKSLSCSYMQGYLFAKPMPISEFEDCLRHKRFCGIDRGAGFSGTDALWNPEAQDSLLFNHLMDGAAILEYDGQNAEILRANDKFYSELGTTRKDYLEKQCHILKRFNANYGGIYRSMLEQAIRTGAEAECEVESLPQKDGGKSYWTYNRVRLLASVKNRSLLYLEVRNLAALVEPKKAALSHWTLSNQDLQTVSQQSGTLICRYYMKTHVIERFYDNPQLRFGVPPRQDNVPDIMVEGNHISPDTAAAYLKLFDQIFREVPSGSENFRLRTMSKGFCWYHADYTLIYDSENRPDHALITFYDISKEKSEQ